MGRLKLYVLAVRYFVKLVSLSKFWLYLLNGMHIVVYMQVYHLKF